MSETPTKRRKSTFIAKCMVDAELPAVTTYAINDGWFGVKLDGETAVREYEAHRVVFVNPKTGLIPQ